MMNDFLAILIGSVALAASLGVLRWVYHRPRVVRLFYRAEDVRLEVNRLQNVNLGSLKKRFDDLLLVSVDGKQTRHGWQIVATWRKPKQDSLVIRRRP